MKMKYIVVYTGEEEFMFIFPNTPAVFHSSMANLIRHLKDGRMMERVFDFADIISAGFVWSDGKCGGESESLGIKSREEDTALFAAGGHRYL